MDRDSIMAMDPNILVSVINMKLRDFYPNLKGFCEEFGVSENELKNKLSKAGYEYVIEQNQFK
ncbi:DUF4250 domain-containing protein [Clostridium carnis]